MPKDFFKKNKRHGKRIMIAPMDYRIIYTLVTDTFKNN